jgi:hypothetical protein
MKGPEPVQSSSSRLPPRARNFLRFSTSSSENWKGKWLVK